MAVLQVDLLGASRAGNQSLEKTTYTQVWQVLTDSEDDGPKTVSDAVTIDLGEAYESGNDADAAAFCTSKRARQINAQADGSTAKWEVELEYSTDAGDAKDPPLQRPTEISVASLKTIEAADKTVDGQKICNSAGERFARQPEQRRVLIKIVMKRYEATYDFNTIRGFVDHVNSDTWLNLFQPGTALCEDITAHRELEQGQFLWPHEYTFIVDDDDWEAKLLDAGYHVRGEGTDSDMDGNVEDLERIVDLKGHPLTVESLLDGDGQKLEENGEPVFLNFKIKRTASFNALRLP
jgi:hypothetical protein